MKESSPQLKEWKGKEKEREGGGEREKEGEKVLIVVPVVELPLFLPYSPQSTLGLGR